MKLCLNSIKNTQIMIINICQNKLKYFDTTRFNISSREA